MEQIDFRSWKISTLRQLAKAFDLALVVRFESFGRFLDEVLPVERAALERPSFEDDPAVLKSTVSIGADCTKGSFDPGTTLRFPRIDADEYAALDAGVADAGIANSSTSQNETIAIYPRALRRG